MERPAFGMQQPDAVFGLIEQIANSVERLEKLWAKIDEQLRGNGKPGVIHQADKNREDIAALRGDMEKLRNSVEMWKPVESEKVLLVRWHVIGSAIGLAAGLLAFLMQVYGG